jgi:O-antigen biosynthesis protein
VRLPLSALRSRLDAASEGLRWTVDPDGVRGRVLVLRADTTATFPLVLAGDAAFTARAMLLPHDWRDRQGAIRAWIGIRDDRGSERVLWQRTLDASDVGRPGGHPAACTLPSGTIQLSLGAELLRAHGPHPLHRAIWVDPVLSDPGAPTPAPRAEPAPSASPGEGPLISVLIPVHDPHPNMLDEAVASIREQTYPNWELRMVDDGSTNPDIVRALQWFAASDARIHLIRHDMPGGISAATNAALHAAQGEFVALLDHDDTLSSDALQHVADTIAAQPDLDMVYSDEDIVMDGRRVWGHFKPGWSPDTLRTNGYTCHLGVYRRDRVTEVGGFRTEYNGSQDVDMILRLVERTDRIAHVPHVLYHWRAHPASAAGGDQAKPLAYLAQPRAIGEHLQRSEIEAAVQFGQSPGLHRIVHRVDPGTSVDLVLAVHSADGLTDAAASWLAQPHPTWHLILTAPQDVLPNATAALHAAGLNPDRITALAAPPGAHPAHALTTAAASATAEHLLLLQSPAIGLTHDWLTRLLGYSAQTGIGAAGPVLLAPDGRIQHAGIAIPDGIPLHLHYGGSARAAPPAVYNLSAVSGVLCTPRAVYQQVGGLRPEHRDLALIDYCLRAGDQHHRTVIVPDARLRTTGPDTTTNDLPALWHLRTTWATTHTHDPYYNPNYRTDRGDFVLQRYD